MPVASLYNVLKVAPDAPVEVIRAAYRALASRFHPDRCHDDPEAGPRMQRVNEAYRVLSDPKLRAQHDALLGRQRRRRASDGASGPAKVDVAPRPEPAPKPSVAHRQRVVATYASYGTLRH